MHKGHGYIHIEFYQSAVPSTLPHKLSQRGRMRVFLLNYFTANNDTPQLHLELRGPISLGIRG